MPELEPGKPQGYEMSDIPADEETQGKRGWKIEVNGEPLQRPVRRVILRQERMGLTIDLGYGPEGSYDHPTIKEPGGGGSVVVPYLVNMGELYVGVVNEFRLTCTDGERVTVPNVPRGFLDPGETHFQTAKRELAEEAGYTPLDERIIQLPGDGMNPNSAFFVTGKDKGVKAFAVGVRSEEVSLVEDSTDLRKRVFKFNPDVIQPVSKIAERVAGSQFVHWTEAVGVQDMFTVAAMGRLQAFLATSA